MRVVIVGGGILGLAAGRLLARERPDDEVLLFEKEAALAQHQTGRNSGVVHAGLYYEPGSLKARLCRRGGQPLRAFCRQHGLASVELADGSAVGADRVLVCAGLHADRLARVSGESEEPRIVPFRGEYWRLHAPRSHLVRGLVYPVPDLSLPFLGVHLTRTVGGSVLVGPNAVLAYAREAYRRRDVATSDLWDTVSWPGMWRVARRHWRFGRRGDRASSSKRAFVRETRRLVPELRPDDVVPGTRRRARPGGR